MISAHRFASANPRALATTRRSGFTLARRLLGKFLCARPNSFESVRARSFRRNVTMRAADECHPLPDQLHPCLRFSWFSSSFSFQAFAFDLSRSQEDRCVSRRLRSLQRGMTCFCKSRSVRSRRLVPFASPVSSPASALHSVSLENGLVFA